MIHLALDVASWVLLVSGGALGVIGGVGVVRMPDFYTRLHASGVTDTLSAYLLLAGLALQAGLSMATVKLGLIVFFLFFTTPVATHALANAAYEDGLTPWTAPPPETEEDPPSVS